MRRSLSVLLSALVAAAASAQTPTHFFVDAKNGNDNNPGTRAKPFRSITKGVATGQQDAVIHVMPGTYSPTKTGEKFTITFTAVYKNVKLLGADAATCVIDFEKVNASTNSWYFLVDSGARDIEIGHLTMKNGAFRPAVPWFSAAIWWRNVNGLEVHHCFIETCESGIYSANGARKVRVHDNVFLGCNIPVRFRQDAAQGAKDCRFFNNLVANSTGAFPDTVSPSTKDPTQVFVNNLVMNNKGDGFRGGFPAGMVFENNNSWNNGGQNYVLGRAVPKSNISKDPLLVNFAKRDYRLKPGSPNIEAGFATGQPAMVNDFYGDARVTDVDGDRRAVPDIGVHEVSGISLSVSNWGQGKTALLSLTANQGNVGAGFLFLAVRPGSVVVDPIGSIGLDVSQAFLVGSSSIPGKLPLTIPSNPFLTGWTIYLQAFAINGPVFKPSGRLDLLL